MGGGKMSDPKVRLALMVAKNHLTDWPNTYETIADYIEQLEARDHELGERLNGCMAKHAEHINVTIPRLEAAEKMNYRLAELTLMLRDSLAYVRATVPKSFSGDLTYITVPYDAQRLAAINAAISAGEYAIAALGELEATSHE
jgi:hypothetical protein